MVTANILTCDEEIVLGRRACHGDLVARNELVERTRPLALYLARSYQRRCFCREDDLIQAAFLGLIRGANRYDPDAFPGKRFATIARYYMRLELLSYLYGRALIRIPHSARPTEIATHPVSVVSSKWQQYRMWTEHCAANAEKVVQGRDEELNYPDPSQCDSDLEESHAEDLRQLRAGLEMLSPWHAEVLQRRFGLGGRPQETIKTIAREAGLSKQTVYTVQNLALRRLRRLVTTLI